LSGCPAYLKATCWPDQGYFAGSARIGATGPRPQRRQRRWRGTPPPSVASPPKAEDTKPEDPFHLHAAGAECTGMRQAVDDELHDEDMDRRITGASPCCAQPAQVNPASPPKLVASCRRHWHCPPGGGMQRQDHCHHAAHDASQSGQHGTEHGAAVGSRAGSSGWRPQGLHPGHRLCARLPSCIASRAAACCCCASHVLLERT